MFYKNRQESNELIILRSLNTRMVLSEQYRQYYYNLEKGFEGEKSFDSLAQVIQNDCIILNDLLLKFNNSTFQIDSTIIFQNSLQFYEIKNYEGDYYYDSEKIYRNGQKSEIVNPINQLGRTESLLHQLLQSYGFHIPIKGSVVFINPEFTLYQSPLNKPFIYPSQLNRYLRSLNGIPSKLNRNHKKLAQLLLSLHISSSPFTQVPGYTYEQLKKGIICKVCHSLSVQVLSKGKCSCRQCGTTESIDDAVLRSVQELRLLFPDKKITTNLVHDWCKVVPSKKTIKRILDKNFKLVGIHQWAYYEENND